MKKLENIKNGETIVIAGKEINDSSQSTAIIKIDLILPDKQQVADIKKVLRKLFENSRIEISVREDV